jgi:hypothetical protein
MSLYIIMLVLDSFLRISRTSSPPVATRSGAPHRPRGGTHSCQRWLSQGPRGGRRRTWGTAVSDWLNVAAAPWLAEAEGGRHSEQPFFQRGTFVFLREVFRGCLLHPGTAPVRHRIPPGPARRPTAPGRGAPPHLHSHLPALECGEWVWGSGCWEWNAPRQGRSAGLGFTLLRAEFVIPERELVPSPHVWLGPPVLGAGIPGTAAPAQPVKMTCEIAFPPDGTVFSSSPSLASLPARFQQGNFFFSWQKVSFALSHPAGLSGILAGTPCPQLQRASA